MTFNFTRTGTSSRQIATPYFEDARANIAPYYAAKQTLDAAKTSVRQALAILGAGEIFFDEGFVTDKDGRKRYGYMVNFTYAGQNGVLRVFGLPMRSETARKTEATRIQALLVTRDQLKAAITAQVFNPGSDPLIPHLLADGSRTVIEYIEQQRQLPARNPHILVEKVES
jgi:hypothetical protein